MRHAEPPFAARPYIPTRESPGRPRCDAGPRKGGSPGESLDCDTDPIREQASRVSGSTAASACLTDNRLGPQKCYTPLLGVSVSPASRRASNAARSAFRCSIRASNCRVNICRGLANRTNESGTERTSASTGARNPCTPSSARMPQSAKNIPNRNRVYSHIEPIHPEKEGWVWRCSSTPAESTGRPRSLG